MKRIVGRVAIVMVTALCAVLSADAALAQDALLVGGRFYSASRNFGQDLGPAPLVSQSDIFGGSRYAVVGASPFTAGGTVVDARTGATFPFRDRLLAVDRARPHIFVHRETGVWQLNVATGAETARWLGDGLLIRQCALAYSADLLFCDVHRDDGLTDVVAIDPQNHSFTIATISHFRFPFNGPEPVWMVSSDGRNLYFAQDMGGGDVRLSVLNTPSGQVTTSSVSGLLNAGLSSGLSSPRIVVDEVNDRLIVTGPEITVLTKELTIVGRASLGLSNLALSPHTGRLYLAQGMGTRQSSTQSGSQGGCCDRLILNVLDANTYASLAPPATIPVNGGGPERYMAVLTAPGAPKDLFGIVFGNTVLLSWTNVGGASNFVIDVGLAPGRTDLRLPVGPDARVAVPNVPSGTYYLRIRGGNENGGSRPSSEIKVVVP